MSETPPNTQPHETPDIEPSVQTPEQAEQHEQLVTDDKEILGESTHLRRSMHDRTRKTIDEIHSTAITMRGAASAPRRKILEIFRDRNELKLQRLEEKVATDPKAPHFKRDREWISMYRARRDHWNNKINHQVTTHQNRIEKTYTKAAVRHERYQKHIDKYIHKKVEAIRKKEYRKLQKEQGISRFNYRSQVEFFQSLPEDEKRRITKEAILAIREQNISKGKLSEGYTVDEDQIRRSMDNYERSIG